jgi:undecaprenyl-diphosphatase
MTRHPAGLAGAAAVIALGLNQVVGHAVGETRPYWSHPSVLVLASKANDYAFPSDHATVAGALALGLLWYSWRFGVPAILMAVFSPSRGCTSGPTTQATSSPVY